MAGKCRLTISAFFLLLCSLVSLYGQDVGKDLRLTVARVIYEGGGDWYSNPSSLPNLLEKIRRSTGLPVEKDEIQLSLKSPELFNYPYLYINRHGNISFD